MEMDSGLDILYCSESFSDTSEELVYLDESSSEDGMMYQLKRDCFWSHDAVDFICAEWMRRSSFSTAHMLGRRCIDSYVCPGKSNSTWNASDQRPTEVKEPELKSDCKTWTDPAGTENSELHYAQLPKLFQDADLLSEGKSSDPQVVPAVSDGKNNTNIKRVKKYKRQILSPTSCSPSDAESSPGSTPSRKGARSHIMSERNRRKLQQTLFLELQNLTPKLCNVSKKCAKIAILTTSLEYIQELKENEVRNIAMIQSLTEKRNELLEKLQSLQRLKESVTLGFEDVPQCDQIYEFFDNL